ncbi:MAG: MarR family transcriptional regulator [Candidatus Limnocylindrales bacterium]
MDAPPDAKEIHRLVMELSRTLMIRFDTAVAALGLTVPQAMLLRQLDDGMPMNEVAEALHCDPSNVTGIVDRLERGGLVERRQLETDRRVKRLVLTPEGRQMKRRVESILAAAPGLARLPDADRAVLRDLLNRSIEHP